jgi:hypothetical protein
MKKGPGKEKDEPYTLRVEYLHKLVENSDPDNEDCPLVEIHFVVSPIAFSQSQLKCTGGELFDSGKQREVIEA